MPPDSFQTLSSHHGTTYIGMYSTEYSSFNRLQNKETFLPNAVQNYLSNFGQPWAKKTRCMF